MEKKQNISNAAVAVIAIIALGAAIYFGLKWFPLTGDQIVGHEPEGLVVQSSLEMESSACGSNVFMYERMVSSLIIPPDAWSRRLLEMLAVSS